MIRTSLFALALGMPFGPALRAQDPPQADADARPTIDFVRDIAPILRRSCIECHGPRKQKGDLRMDRKEHLFGDDPDLWTVVPGAPDDSEVLYRVTLDRDDEDFMPKNGSPLTSAARERLRAWIEGGAEWPDDFVIEHDRALAPLVPAPTPEQQAAVVAALRRIEEAQADVDPQRRVVVRKVRLDGAALEVTMAAPRTAGPFALPALDGLEPFIVRVDVAGSAASDDALTALAHLPELRAVDVAHTAVSGALGATLATLPRLEVLRVVGTKFDDAGLAALSDLASLQRVWAWNSNVTEDGAATLLERRPDVLVDRGGSAAAMLDRLRREAAERAAAEQASAEKAAAEKAAADKANANGAEAEGAPAPTEGSPKKK